MTNYFCGDDPRLLDQYACKGGNNGGAPAAAGSKPANPFGLFDMHGNAYEWCGDFFGPYAAASQTDPRGPGEGSRRVLRGGSWYTAGVFCRSSYRKSFPPTAHYGDVGFRIVRELDHLNDMNSSAKLPSSGGAKRSAAAPSSSDVITHTADLLHTLPGIDAEFVLGNKLRIGRKIYDPETGEAIRELLPATETRDVIAGPVVSQNGNRIVWMTKDGELTVWDGVGEKVLWTEQYEPPGNTSRSVSISADGRRLAGHVNRQAFLWDVAKHKQITKFDSAGVYQAKLAPTGHRMIVTHRDGWELRDENGQPIVTQKRGVGGSTVAFNTDSSLAIVAKQLEHGNSKNEFIVIDLQSGKERLTLPHHGYVAAFSPDGRHVFHVALGELSVTPLANSAAKRRMVAMRRGLDCLDVSSDGRFLAGHNIQADQTQVYRLLPTTSAGGN